MRFGVCAPLDWAHEIQSAGFHYIELAANALLSPESPETDWLPLATAMESCPLPVEAMNCFVSGPQITGPDADPERLLRYVDTALTRAARVGVQVMVFGSGGARRIPDGFPQSDAERQLIDFLHMCADACDRTGVVTAIEPLRRAESNVLNSVVEAAAMARAVGRTGVRLLADTFHMEAEDEPLSVLDGVGDLLMHVHTADTGRNSPGTGSYDHVALFRALRGAGYNARVSAECGWGDRSVTLPLALRHMTEAYERSAS